MDFAHSIAELSHARRRKVGAVIVNDNTIVYGYNGMPAGWDNNCEHKVYDQGAGGWLNPDEIETAYPYKEWDDAIGRNVRYGLRTNPEVLHAESNSIGKLARSAVTGNGADMFVTLSPCLECAKLIHQTGIKKVFYRQQYRDTAGIEFLRKSGVDVNQV